MLTKQRMLELINFIEHSFSQEEFNNFVRTTEEKSFLFSYRNLDRKIQINPISLENFCYELSLDKVIDDRNKRIDEILNQV
jgi:hypothetical protein